MGKSWIACALGNKACRDDRRVVPHRVPRLFQMLAIARGDGRRARVLKATERTELQILDEWGLSVLTSTERRNLLEILDDRQGRGATAAVGTPPVWQTAARAGVFLAIRARQCDQGVLPVQTHQKFWFSGWRCPLYQRR
ncbi:ATP-binding protein [Roseinatronobacter sp. NSM]|uniref:ATP-binding protein n=1 Tax=Roseinatronobacter sp. NSM TaxID=3457785 RepID=UPI00403630B6